MVYYGRLLSGRPSIRRHEAEPVLGVWLVFVVFMSFGEASAGELLVRGNYDFLSGQTLSFILALILVTGMRRAINDKRPTFHIKGLSEETIRTTVEAELKDRGLTFENRRTEICLTSYPDPLPAFRIETHVSSRKLLAPRFDEDPPPKLVESLESRLLKERGEEGSTEALVVILGLVLGLIVLVGTVI